ncbi:hypothetical protein [Hoeflea sp. TYP-13]|uniref:hypothetical protein n=1 Tax=Hoeflea sp. TYP-13 TaxID=3230023 RepID=UPI0034C687E1
MPIFTAPDGSPVEIESNAVVRIARTVFSDLDGSSCRIDWKRTDLVRESVPEVLEMIGYELPSLVRLTAESNAEIWINAQLAEGPFPPHPDKEQEGFRAHIVVSGEPQHVMENEERILELFTRAGGTA